MTSIYNTKLEALNLQRISNQGWQFNLDKRLIYPQEKRYHKEGEETLEVVITASDYNLALYAANVIKDIAYYSNTPFQKPVLIQLKDDIHQHTWKLEYNHPTRHLYNPLDWISFAMEKVYDVIPFTKVIQDRRLVQLKISPQENNWLTTIQSFFQKPMDLDVFMIAHQGEEFAPGVHSFNPDASLQEKINIPLFEDPFTKVSTEYFLNWASTFGHNHQIECSYQLAYRNHLVSLTPTIEYPTSSEREENREVVRQYYRHLIETFGPEKVQLIELRYEFDFKKMIRDGTPLFPKHIYRVNIGVNDVEMKDIEQLYAKFAHFVSDHPSDAHLSEIELLSTLQKQYQFTVKELIKLKTLAAEQTISEYIAQLFKDQLPGVVKDLPLASFNQLIQMLTPTPQECDLAYTGRKIVRNAIKSYYTEPLESKYFKPWLDQHELLQTFADLRKSKDWKCYHELLAHIVAKKHLVRTIDRGGYSVGALIPAPNFASEQEDWYYVSSCTDDHLGDFNYTLIPANTNANYLPAIKLYRSTASDEYNMFGTDSVLADTRFGEAPAIGSRFAADQYEAPFFEERTIPVWVGYYLDAQKTYEEALNVTSSQEQYRLLKEIATSVYSALQHVPPEIHESIRKSNQLAAFTALLPPLAPYSEKKLADLIKNCKQALDVLNQEGHHNKELPEYKIATDIAFVGHSLGGCLAQAGLYHVTVDCRRLALPNHKLICYASDAPAISSTEVENFWDFIEKHRFLIQKLNKKWEIITQFEYNDWFAMAGSRHLASTLKAAEIYQNVVELDQAVFRPLEGAYSKAITTLSAHARRIGFARENIDYKIVHLSPQELYEFDHAILLRSDLSKVFGLISPQIFEMARRILAATAVPLINYTYFKLKNWISPPRGADYRDKDGVFAVSYEPVGIKGALNGETEILKSFK